MRSSIVSMLAVLAPTALGCAKGAPDPRLPSHELSGAVAPDLEADGIDGGRISLHALRGQIAVVAFWATWAPACRDALPALERLYTKYHARGLEVIGVSEDDAMAGVPEFVHATGVTFPVAWDDGRTRVADWYARQIPAVFVVDRRGVVRAAFRGWRDGADVEIERELLPLL